MLISTGRISDEFRSVHEGTIVVDQAAEHGLTLSELEEIEESAHRSQMTAPKTVLRLAAALREALQEKENACAIATVLNDANRARRNKRRDFKL